MSHNKFNQKIVKPLVVSDFRERKTARYERSLKSDNEERLDGKLDIFCNLLVQENITTSKFVLIVSCLEEGKQQYTFVKRTIKTIHSCWRLSKKYHTLKTYE